MIINERDLRHQSVVEAAHRMMTAARTAPKAKGVDIIEIALVEEREDLEKLAEAMRRRSEETGFKFLLRDADNILQGEAVILIGTCRHTQGLNCGYCGYSACGQNPAQNPCALNSIDVGIARLCLPLLPPISGLTPCAVFCWLGVGNVAVASWMLADHSHRTQCLVEKSILWCKKEQKEIDNCG